MNRKEVYAKIKELKLQDEIKVKFGDNFTRIPTAKLSAFIEKKSVKVTDNIDALDKVDKLIYFLQKKHILLKSEVDLIYKGQGK